MESQVTNICKSAHFHLRNIGSIRHVLTESSSAQLVHALISSRLDYCNSLLNGIPDSQIKRLQKVQNNAARVVCRIRKYDHITPTLQSLHWLPVKSRIQFKTLLLTYQSLHGRSPSYLSDLLVQHVPTRSLRSSNQNLLKVPKSNSKQFGDRCFSVVAPKAWNALPDDIKSSSTVDMFKKKLKTHLFKQAYGQ